MSSSDEFVRDLLLSLPPMEANDLTHVITQAASSSGLNANASALEQEIAIRTCCKKNNNNKSSTTSSPLATALEKKLEEHQETYYGDDKANATARYTVEQEEDGETSLCVQTYAELLDASNWRTGSWTATWTVQPNADKETEATIHGHVQLHVYYFENQSNIQLRANRTFQEQTAETPKEQVHAMVAKFESRKMSYEQKVANAVVGQMARWEAELYQDLLKLFDDEIETKMRKIRRILPVTKTRFKWDSAAQKQIKLLNDRKTDK